MKWSFFPKTRPGRWSVLLFLLLVLLVSYFFVMVKVFGQRGGDTFFSNLNLTIPMLSAWAAGFSSFIFGLIAVFRAKSRAVLVYLVLILSFLTTLYGILEVSGPH